MKYIPYTVGPEHRTSSNRKHCIPNLLNVRCAKPGLTRIQDARTPEFRIPDKISGIKVIGQSIKNSFSRIYIF